MNNERGFILPIVLTISFLLFSFLSFQVNHYLLEKELYHDANERFTSERLLQMAVVDTKEIVMNAGSIEGNGILYYEYGEVHFDISVAASNVSLVVLKSTIFKSNKKKQLKYYFYHEDKTVMPWLEER